MADILDANRVRFNRGDLVWTVSLAEAGLDELIDNKAPNAVVATTKILFLETGNARAGLKHIWARHGEEFTGVCGVQDMKGAGQKILDIVKLGHYATFGFQESKAKPGEFAVLYQINESTFLQLVFGSNGFVVTSFPITGDGNTVAIKWDY